MHDVADPARTILVVEDDRVNQRVTTAMLQHLGFRVEVVTDGLQAVEAAGATPYRAILMDCQIPVLDGYQASREIRRVQGTSLRTPIIAVTASDEASDRERCLAADMDDYLTKPISVKALAAVLERWDPAGPVDGDAASPWVPASPADPRSAEAAPPVLDPQVVERLTRLGSSVGDDLMEQLAVVFLADAKSRIASLHHALAENDAAAVVRSAHTLRGASAHLGANDLARLCGTLSRAGTAGDLAGAGRLLDAIESELGRVRSALGSPDPISTP